MKQQKKTIVLHSGGMDSSLCLAIALQEYDKSEITAISFDYDQRHSVEIKQAAKICYHWGVDHLIIPLDCLQTVTANALMNTNMSIEHTDKEPNTLVVGRNGLMARLGAIYANTVGAHSIYIGIVEPDQSGYRDCSRSYMDKVQEVLRLDLDNPSFEIRTPVVAMTKRETMDQCYDLGILEYLLENTITCYEGIPHQGCETCPSCKLRLKGLQSFLEDHPDFIVPYTFEKQQELVTV